MILSASDLTTAQRCPRRWLLNKSPDGASRRWLPKEIFEASLRRGVLELSSGKPKESAVASARAGFLEIAAQPGLDADGDTYRLAQDFCAALSTVLEAVSRQIGEVGKLELVPPVELGPDLSWQPGCFVAPDGRLHRWVTVDRASAAALSAEFHSWYVFGDMAATGRGMKLWVVERGQIRDGRLGSPWCRTWRHPGLNKYHRFGKGGKALQGAWKPVWYAESDDRDPAKPEAWVDSLAKEELLPKLLRSFEMDPLGAGAVALFRAEVASEASRLRSLPGLELVPLSRPACDLPRACPWQFVCYPG